MDKTQKIWMLMDIFHKSVNSGYPNILEWSRSELKKLDSEFAPKPVGPTAFPGENLEDPELDLDYIPNVARKKEVQVALSNSFGFGGHNATLVFKNYTSAI